MHVTGIVTHSKLVGVRLPDTDSSSGGQPMKRALRHGWMTIAGGFLTGAAAFLLTVDVPAVVQQGFDAPKALPSALLGLGIAAVVSGARRAVTKIIESLPTSTPPNDAPTVTLTERGDG